MTQRTFSGTDYGFRWVGDWYEWDKKVGEKEALRQRNAYAKELASQGFAVKKFSLGTQLVSKGGIGSGHPHIEMHTKTYGVNTF